MDDLKNLEDLLTPYLRPNKIMKHIDISKPPPGGFGSLMLKVEVTLENADGNDELLHLVGKKIPTEEIARQVFDIQTTFKKEASFYSEILPTLNEFRNEEGVHEEFDNFAKFYGARYNLSARSDELDVDEVDEDAVMLLEDLSVKGFRCIDRREGFDLKGARALLHDLAEFHGTSLALKHKKPYTFEMKIKSHCSHYSFPNDIARQKMLQVLKKVIESYPDCAHLAEKATSFFERDGHKFYSEPFGTLIHHDLWNNNILCQIEGKKIVKNVFVDFQLYDYGSPAYDVFFFLWTSVRKEVLEQHLDELIIFYYENLISTLKRFKIDTSILKYYNFEAEMRLAAYYEFGHALLFTFYMKFVKNIGEMPDKKIELSVDQISPKSKEFIRFMVQECNSRGWLY